MYNRANNAPDAGHFALTVLIAHWPVDLERLIALKPMGLTLMAVLFAVVIQLADDAFDLDHTIRLVMVVNCNDDKQMLCLANIDGMSVNKFSVDSSWVDMLVDIYIIRSFSKKTTKNPKHYFKGIVME